MQETQVQSLGREDLLEKEMATHSSILEWRIPRPWCCRVRHDRATNPFTSIPYVQSKGGSLKNDLEGLCGQGASLLSPCPYLLALVGRWKELNARHSQGLNMWLLFL